MALGMALKFYTSVEKGLKLKLKIFSGLAYYVCKSYRQKTGRTDLLGLPHPEWG